jgi:hypothetical protein
MKKCISSLLIFILPYIAFSSAYADGENPESGEPERNYRGASLRLGAFAIEDIDTRVYFGPTDIPLRAVIDIRKDLGMKDSLVAFRGDFQYRFSKHHAINVGYYNLDLDGTVRLSRTIELGDTEFDIGIDVLSQYKEQITKLAYNWIFHDEGRVMLSLTPGLHVSKASLSIQALGTGIGGNLGFDERENASVTAPLPMLGGRIVYRLTDKWSIVGVSDIFFLDRGSQEGQLNDTHLFVEYQANEHFSFGGGLNRFSLDLQLVDDDIIWDWSSVYTGAYLYMGFHF